MSRCYFWVENALKTHLRASLVQQIFLGSLTLAIRRGEGMEGERTQMPNPPPFWISGYATVYEGWWGVQCGVGSVCLFWRTFYWTYPGHTPSQTQRWWIEFSLPQSPNLSSLCWFLQCACNHSNPCPDRVDTCYYLNTVNRNTWGASLRWMWIIYLSFPLT